MNGEDGGLVTKIFASPHECDDYSDNEPRN